MAAREGRGTRKRRLRVEKARAKWNWANTWTEPVEPFHYDTEHKADPNRWVHVHSGGLPTLGKRRGA